MTIDDDHALLMAAKVRSRMAEQAQERTSVVILDSGKYTFYVRNNVLFCDRYHLKEWREFLGDKAVHALFQEVLELRERLAKLSAVETSRDLGPWTVDEKLPDGNWRRHATAHAWETNADAHRQCEDLQRRYPKKIFGVVSMASPVKTSDAARPSTQCASCGLNHGACCC